MSGLQFSQEKSFTLSGRPLLYMFGPSHPASCVLYWIAFNILRVALFWMFACAYHFSGTSSIKFLGSSFNRIWGQHFFCDDTFILHCFLKIVFFNADYTILILLTIMYLVQHEQWIYIIAFLIHLKSHECMPWYWWQTFENRNALSLF